MTPYRPKYVPQYRSPEQAAQDRARRRSALFWIAVAVPVAFALMAFGYSDQAPAFLRSITIGLDRQLGYPILWLIGWIGSR